MADAFYDPTKLHPGELTGILISETQMCGIINDRPVRRSAMPYEKIEIYADNNRTLRVYVKDEDLNVIDLTGATAVMTVRETKDDPVVFTKSTAVSGEGQIGAADEGEIFFYLVPSDTASLDIRQYVFDVEVTLSSGKKYTVLEGIINLLQPVG